MGKFSGILIFLLMVNLIGYVLMTDYVDAYPNTAGNMTGIIQNNPLLGLYSSRTDNVTGSTYYDVSGNSAIYANACGSSTSGNASCVPPSGFFATTASFIDRIFILFGWIRVVIAIGLFPVTLLSMLGLPWQLAMLVGVPLATLYILGIIDLFSSGGT